MHAIIVMLGPTASGKSALGVRLAEQFRGVVVSADSRQVYRGLERCFGTITKREMRGVPHFLLRFVSLQRQYTAGEYARAFQRVLKRIPTRTPVFLVGGSPFYIEAALHPDRLAAVPPQAGLRKQLARLTLPQLLARLKRLDPKRYATIDRHNRRRLIRAIEIPSGRQSSGKPLTTHYSPLTSRVLKIGLPLPRTQLYKKIDRRVDQRLADGMLQEVARAHRRGVSWKRLDALGLEARFLAQHLRGQRTREEAVTRLKGAIHAFARRQLTWWRNDQGIHWIRHRAEAERLVGQFLRRSRRAGGTNKDAIERPPFEIIG